MEIEIKTDDVKEMAEKGENGDTVMGHLTPGEIVLPLPIAQKLEEVLKKEFELANMDIDQYIVGHEKNSINEESGCPEFARAETQRLAQEMEALQSQMQREQAAATEQIAKTAQEAQGIQRETGERKLSRVRARVRSLSRPMLSKGVSL